MTYPGQRPERPSLSPHFLLQEQKLFMLREQGQICDAVVNEKATKQEYHLSGTHFSTYFCGALHSNDVKSPKNDFLTTMRAHKCESFIFYLYCENARTVLFLWYKYTGFVRAVIRKQEVVDVIC